MVKYIRINTLSIDGNQQLLKIKDGYKFDGDGTLQHPIIIKYVRAEYGIFLSNITLHVIIENCITKQIQIDTTYNCIIRHNYILPSPPDEQFAYRSEKVGMVIQHSTNCVIYDNVIIHGSIGLQLKHSDKCMVVANIIADCREEILEYSQSHNTIILHNTFYNSNDMGIYLSLTDIQPGIELYTMVYNNAVINCKYGISVSDTALPSVIAYNFVYCNRQFDDFFLGVSGVALPADIRIYVNIRPYLIYNNYLLSDLCNIWVWRSSRSPITIAIAYNVCASRSYIDITKHTVSYLHSGITTILYDVKGTGKFTMLSTYNKVSRKEQLKQLKQYEHPLPS